jgi:hypothetical protein
MVGSGSVLQRRHRVIDHPALKTHLLGDSYTSAEPAVRSLVGSVRVAEYGRPSWTTAAGSCSGPVPGAPEHRNVLIYLRSAAGRASAAQAALRSGPEIGPLDVGWLHTG